MIREIWGVCLGIALATVTPLMAEVGKRSDQEGGISLLVDDGYLHVPVYNYHGKPEMADNSSLVGIFLGEKLVQNFNVPLPREGQPYWVAMYPIDHYNLRGKTITVNVVADSKMSAAAADLDQWAWALGRISIGDDLPAEKTADYAKPYRNQFRASSRRGWIQDPNGMVFHNGKYHLYFQYNPFGIWPANKHWGHWESEDLIHWEEKPIALYTHPKKGAMFSGGGFVDFNNSAGFGRNTQFAAYTATKLGESLAYSKDGGLTFTEIPENPVVVHKGRDPKIFWYEPERKWAMMVYNFDEVPETLASPTDETGKHAHANMAFYESKDLRHWERTGAFTHPDRFSVWECPEIFKLPIEGESGFRWILFGGQSRYFIGKYNGRTFVAESGPHGDKSGDYTVAPYSAHGAFYAAQNFSDVPDGRMIRMGWLKDLKSYVDLFPKQLTSQAMSLPHELKLRRTKKGLRMASEPVVEVEKLRVEELPDLNACKGELTEVIIEFEESGMHELVINGIDASFEGKSARIFTDRTFNEVYANDGLYYKVRTRNPDTFDSTETVVKNGAIKSLKVYRLQSIWE